MLKPVIVKRPTEKWAIAIPMWPKKSRVRLPMFLQVQIPPTADIKLTTAMQYVPVRSLNPLVDVPKISLRIVLEYAMITLKPVSS